MWELDHKEGWAAKNSCFWTVVLEKTLESPLDNKEVKSVNPKGNQPWIFIGRKDWCRYSNTLATWYNRLVAEDWYWERLRVRREGDNSGWDGQMVSSTQSEQTLWQGNLACCSPWGSKESDMTEWLNDTTEWLNNNQFIQNRQIHRESRFPVARNWGKGRWLQMSTGSLWRVRDVLNSGNGYVTLWIH